jgi:hypothetical protein
MELDSRNLQFRGDIGKLLTTYRATGLQVGKYGNCENDTRID